MYVRMVSARKGLAESHVGHSGSRVVRPKEWIWAGKIRTELFLRCCTLGKA